MDFLADSHRKNCCKFYLVQKYNTKLSDSKNNFFENFTDKGDVVVLDRQKDGIFIKRVVAVAGDTVNIQDGTLYVDGRECIVESAVGETHIPDRGIEYPLQLGDKEIFVIGDNRGNSEDSRHFGAVRTEDIKGKVLFYFGSIR